VDMTQPLMIGAMDAYVISEPAAWAWAGAEAEGGQRCDAEDAERDTIARSLHEGEDAGHPG